MTSYIIAGTFLNASGVGQSGAAVSVWKASRFSGPPALGASPPSGLADATGVTTSSADGSAGAFQITAPTCEPYYIEIVYGGVTYWQYQNPEPGFDTGAQVFNILGYEAVGNGTADDTASISAAITAASAAGGGVVVCPAQHLVTSSLSVPAGVTVTGLDLSFPWGNVASPSRIKVATSVTGQVFDLTGSNSSVKNLSIVNATTAVTTPAISATSISGVRLQNIYVSGVGGILASGMNRSLVEDVVLENYAGATGFNFTSCSILFINRCNAAPVTSGIGANFSLTSCTSINLGSCESNGLPTYGLYSLDSNDCEAWDFESNGGTVGHICLQGGNDWELHRPYTQSNMAPTALDIIDSGIVAVIGGWIGNGSAYTLRIRTVSGASQDIRVAAALIDGTNLTGSNPPVSIEGNSLRIAVDGNSIIAKSGGTVGLADTSTSSSHHASYVGNTFHNVAAATAITVATPGTNVKIAGNAGFQPGPQTPPSVPATTVALTNPFPFECTVYVAGGTVTAIAVGGTATGMTGGPIVVPSGQTITLTYSASPTWTWFGN